MFSRIPALGIYHARERLRLRLDRKNNFSAHHDVDGTKFCDRKIEQCDLILPLHDVTPDKGRRSVWQGSARRRTGFSNSKTESHCSSESTYPPSFLMALATVSAPTASKSPITTLALYQPQALSNLRERSLRRKKARSLTHVSQKSARSPSQSRSQHLDRVHDISTACRSTRYTCCES